MLANFFTSFINEMLAQEEKCCKSFMRNVSELFEILKLIFNLLYSVCQKRKREAMNIRFCMKAFLQVKVASFPVIKL